MIDLHCHLLCGIDDGPDTPEESLELCRLAVADGITHSGVTPHMVREVKSWQSGYWITVFDRWLPIRSGTGR
jgi:tyrosine-protein phosphatase YwqE